MKKNNIDGIIAVSPYAFPGEKSNMSMIQFSKLLKEGWKYALYWDGKGNFSDFMRESKRLFTNNGLTMPKSIYFKSGTYSKNLDKIIINYGFNTVIHTDDSFESVTSCYFENNIWKIGVNNAFSNNVTFLNEVLKYKGNLVLEMNLDDEVIEIIDTKTIEHIFSLLKKYENENNFVIATIDEARNLHSKLSYKDKILKNRYISERKKLEEEIAKIDKQMKDIYYGQEK